MIVIFLGLKNLVINCCSSVVKVGVSFEGLINMWLLVVMVLIVGLMLSCSG